MALHGEWTVRNRGLLEGPEDADFHRGVLGRPTPCPPSPASRCAAAASDAARPARLGHGRTPSGPRACRPLLGRPLVAEIEHAWLTDRPEFGRGRRSRPRAVTEKAGRERDRGELLRWLRRTGKPVEVFAGCPEEYAAGLRGIGRPPRRPGSRSGSVRAGTRTRRSAEVPPQRWRRLTVFDGLGAGRPRRGHGGGCGKLGEPRGAARSETSDPQQPGRAHRPAGGDPRRCWGDGSDERRDRGPARRSRYAPSTITCLPCCRSWVSPPASRPRRPLRPSPPPAEPTDTSGRAGGAVPGIRTTSMWLIPSQAGANPADDRCFPATTNNRSACSRNARWTPGLFARRTWLSTRSTARS